MESGRTGQAASNEVTVRYPPILEASGPVAGMPLFVESRLLTAGIESIATYETHGIQLRATSRAQEQQT